MRILISPDSFKGSLSAPEAARAIARGLERSGEDFECETLPLADGGEGSVDCLLSAVSGEKVSVEVKGPLRRPVSAEYGLLDGGEVAVMEMAAASGLTLLEEDELDPLQTTTYGTGELICDALDRGVERILLGIGGSATNDGGMGLARALGVKFFDESGDELLGCGASLNRIKSIDTSGLDERIQRTDIEVACDVDNPLYGERGAARVYAPQKGAYGKQVKVLDEGLRNYSSRLEEFLGIDISSLPGAGAAGGLGGGLRAFLDAELLPGIDMIMDYFNYAELLQEFDLVISGEGSCDLQSLQGKVVGGVAERTSAAGVPVVVLAGSIPEEKREKFRERGITSLFSIVDGPADLKSSLEKAPDLLESTAEEIGYLLAI